jgi:putative transposase
LLKDAVLKGSFDKYAASDRKRGTATVDAEFLADCLAQWCAERRIALRYIQPGKPNQNAFIERFNRTYRTEVLDAYVFESLDQVREISAAWVQSYNEERPHEALAGLPPATYRAQQMAGSSPLKLSP